jgi:hypothetical protein
MMKESEMMELDPNSGRETEAETDEVQAIDDVA